MEALYVPVTAEEAGFTEEVERWRPVRGEKYWYVDSTGDEVATAYKNPTISTEIG